MSDVRLESLTPDQRQELAAGYVLGDLDPEELILFQELLAQEPMLTVEVQQLQETLGALPYGLPMEQPRVGVRSQILQAATPNLRSQRPRPQPWLWGIGGLAAGMLLMLGGQGLLQEQWATQPDVLQASSQFVAENWEDLDEVVADHTRSLTQAKGPVDVATDAIADIRTHYAHEMPLPTTLPQLQSAQLLGGSFCNLKHTRGLRFTYKTPAGQTVSVYQLARTDQVTLPHLKGTKLYLRLQQGPNIALWQDQSFIYVLATQLPVPKIQDLTFL